LLWQPVRNLEGIKILHKLLNIVTSNIEPTLNQHWTNIEPTLNQHWTNIEPTLNQHWTNIEPTLNPHWTNIEPATLNQHWTNNIEPTDLNSLNGWMRKRYDSLWRICSSLIDSWLRKNSSASLFVDEASSMLSDIRRQLPTHGLYLA